MRSHDFPQFISKTSIFKLILIVALLLAGFLLIFIDPLKLNSSDFMLFAWYPGQELLMTGSVHLDYPYPLWTVVILLPFTIWTPRMAILLWFICNLIMLAACIVLLIRLFEWSGPPVFFLSIVILCGYFLPVLTSIWLGQLTIFLMLILTLTAYLFKYQRWRWLGFVLGLSFIKPQVMILLVGFLLFWALWQRRWQVLIGFGMAVIFLLLISLPFISKPIQIIGGGIGSHLVTYIQQTSTLWGLLLLFGFSWWAPLVISLILLAWLGYIWFHLPTQIAVLPDRMNYIFSVTIIINLMIVPYSWMHNLALLLLPLGYGLTLVLRMKSGARFIWLILLFGIMHPLMLGVFNKLSGPLVSQAYQVIPAIVLLPTIYFLELQATPRSESH